MMARFRNLLVHRYGDIDAERVWVIVSTSLGDLEEYFEAIGQHLQAESNDS